MRSSASAVLQLVHGRIDERLRVPGTLAALAALVDHGYIDGPTGRNWSMAYRFLRVLSIVSNSSGCRHPPDARRSGWNCGGSHAVWTWRPACRSSSAVCAVVLLQQRVFYSPLLERSVGCSGDDLRLSADVR